MAILTGKPSSISANTTSSSITLNTTDLISLLDTVTADAYWKDIARIKSVLFVYRNSNRQKVNLKFIMPSTSSAISINEHSRNGDLTCSKIVITGTANDSLTISRSSFNIASEFDLTVTDGYATPGLQGIEAISWISPITTTSSTYVAETDGGLYKSGGPSEMSLGFYDLSVRSSQELSSSDGFFEIDILNYSGFTPEGQSNNSIYGTEEVVGFSYGSRDATGGYDSIDFAIKRAGSASPSEKSIQVYENGILNSSIVDLQSPGFGSPSDYFRNKIRVQLKNGNVEFFVNNVKYKTLVGALASVSYPLFVEASLRNPYLVGQPQTGSGFQESRIGSSISTAGTIVRTADFTAPSVDMDISTLGNPTIVSQQYIEFAEPSFPGMQYGLVISNIGSSSGYTFQTPVIEENPYVIRLYVDSYIVSTVPGTIEPSLYIYSGDLMLTTPVSSSSLAAAVGSYVDIPYTPYFSGSTDMYGFRMVSNIGLNIIAENTTQYSYIRISKIEIIEA